MKKRKQAIIDIETTTFIPWENGRIICIGHKDLKNNKITVYQDEDERTLITTYINNFHNSLAEKVL